MLFEICNNDYYITVVAELMKSKDVFGANLKLKSPFSTDAATIYGLRAFLLVIETAAIRKNALLLDSYKGQAHS